jgi:hypothetical protein
MVKVKLCSSDIKLFQDKLNDLLPDMTIPDILLSAGSSTCQLKKKLGDTKNQNQFGGADWADIVAAVLLAGAAVGGVTGVALVFMWLYPECEAIPREYFKWHHLIPSRLYDYKGFAKGVVNTYKWVKGEPLEQVCEMGELPLDKVVMGSSGLMGLIALTRNYTHKPLAQMLRNKFGSREKLDEVVLKQVEEPSQTNIEELTQPKVEKPVQLKKPKQVIINKLEVLIENIMKLKRLDPTSEAYTLYKELLNKDLKRISNKIPENQNNLLDIVKGLKDSIYKIEQLKKVPKPIFLEYELMEGEINEKLKDFLKQLLSIGKTEQNGSGRNLFFKDSSNLFF